MKIDWEKFDWSTEEEERVKSLTGLLLRYQRSRGARGISLLSSRAAMVLILADLRVLAEQLEVDFDDACSDSKPRRD